MVLPQPRDRKYPKGASPNRTAASGCWKATGTDKPILSSHASQCLGVKKAVIFYKVRAPKGTKTNWMMYEYLLPNNRHPSVKLNGSMRLDDSVLCRIRHKGITTELKQETCTNSSENGCTADPEGCEESIAKTEDHNFKNYKFTCQNDGDIQGRIGEGLISDKISIVKKT